MSGAREAYERRLADWRARARAWEVARSAAWWSRLAGGAAFAVLVWLASERRVDPGWLWVPAVAVAVLTVSDAVLETRARRARRGAAFHHAGLDRLDGRWAAAPEGGTAPPDGAELASPGHAYAFDLDVLGDRSLFQLLGTVRTRPGAETLARWLCAPAAPDAIRERQAAVEELRGDLDLREALALAGEPGRAEVDAAALTAWGEGASFLPWSWLRAPLLALSVAVVVSGSLWVAGARGGGPFLAALAAAVAVHLALRLRVAATTAEVSRPARQLATLAAVIRRLERTAFRAPLLLRLRDGLAGGPGASRAVARLDRLAAGLRAARVEVVAPFAYGLAVPAQYALAVESWRRRHGGRIGAWLAALGELEALLALSGHAWEHPDDPFPEIAPGGATFHAEGLGHPLLPEGACVPNDVHLGGDGPRLLLLSGSNMSGKSTLLRAVGTNAALALAGAPVRARRLRLSPLAVAASVRVRDSLLDGESRFYAEIKRLREVMRLADGPLPVLFLLDEILHGTNSHDRRQGAEGILRGLLDRGAVGIATTHDLALTEVAAALGGAAANAHFGDELRDGRLRFDYRLRPGVVRHSNALALMRAVGLDV